jgi:hypothetical protein
MTTMVSDVVDRCDAIEECYEFMLAYAAQGHTGEQGGRAGQLRELLARAVQAAQGLAQAYAGVVGELGLEPAGPHQAFGAVLARDAASALAAMELVLAQPRLSSQLIDNLNASIHLRALLTDLFLVDEVVRLRRQAGEGPDA